MTSRPTTPEFVTAVRPRPNSSPTSNAATTPLAARRRSRSAAPTRWPDSPRRSSDRSPGDFDVRFGSKYEPPLLETTAESFRADGFDVVVGLVLAPHSSSMSTDQYMSRAQRGPR